MTALAQPAASPEPGPSLLEAIDDPARGRIAAAHVAVVVAHPDDETIGCGALLGRLAGVKLVLVTDGAPRNLADARTHGLGTASAYAATRRRELATALEAAGALPGKLVVLGIADQEAARQLAALSRRLAQLFRREAISEVLTHAYEGGHPDHDATAFAVHAAGRLLAREGRELSVVEMPFYRLGPEGMLPQSLAGPADQVVVTKLTEQERGRKARMLKAHATQREVLAQFGTDAERFRPAPKYDFGILPNEGALYYTGRGWGMTGEEWLRNARAALVELGMMP